MTPPNYVFKEEIHDLPSRMLHPGVRRISNDVRSGARRYYEGLQVEEHGNAFVTRHVVYITRMQMLLKEDWGMQINLESPDVDVQHDCTDT